MDFPYKTSALLVEQPLGIFYVAVLPARLLLDVAYSDALSASLLPDKNTYELEGTQRSINQARLTQIKDYINRTDAAFPNSIILAANFQRDTGLIEDNFLNDSDDALRGPEKRWDVSEDENGCLTLTIPTKEKLAAIIDGQHRLFGFVQANPERLNMSLMCSIYLDLPKPYQAQLFATINSTQKRVDKSLTYELFGYNVEEESEELWTPDKLAVFFSRRLATDPESPLQGRIVIAPQKDAALAKLSDGVSWKVSTAVVVEGIMRLFTSNPKKDTTRMLENTRKSRKDLANLRNNDHSPMRDLYLNSQDVILYKTVLNYLIVCKKLFWAKATNDSFIIKTIGIQALFDVLRSLAGEASELKNVSKAFFEERLAPAADIDFSSVEFRNASGSGRSFIRRAITDRIDA